MLRSALYLNFMPGTRNFFVAKTYVGKRIDMSLFDFGGGGTDKKELQVPLSECGGVAEGSSLALKKKCLGFI